jgi:hypothetical protein
MAVVPSDQKFHTVPSNVQTVERGSALANSQREIYTMQDIIETVGGLSYYVLRSFTQSIGSNSTGETQLLQLTIPANSFNTTDKFSFFAIFSKTAAEQGITLRVKVSTSASMPLGNTDTIAFAAPGLTTRFVKLNRDMIINGGNLKGFGFTTSVITDQAASSLPLSSVSFDVTQIHYLYVSVQPAATTTDVTFLEAFEIKNL